MLEAVENRFRDGHVRGIQKGVAQGRDVRVRGGGCGRGRCYLLNATCI